MNRLETACEIIGVALVLFCATCVLPLLFVAVAVR